MASTVIDPIAEAIADVISGLSVTPTVKEVKWFRRELPTLPCGVIDMPTISRTEPEERESQLNTNDWFINYPVSLYFDLAEPVSSQVQATEVVEAFIMAVDDDTSLSGLVLEAKVVSAEPILIPDDPRPMIEYKTTVQVAALVAP